VVKFSLPSNEYDALYALARRERVTVPDVIRQLIARGHRRDDDNDDE
jgi:hypothetical protein